MTQKDNSGWAANSIMIFVLLFALFTIIGLLTTCSAQEPDIEAYSIEAWNENNAEWQAKLDSMATVNNQNCDSLEAEIVNYKQTIQSIYDIIAGHFPQDFDTTNARDSVVFIHDTIHFYDTLLFHKQYVGGVEFEQAGYYMDSIQRQNVYFKLRNFDTIFHNNIYVDVWQGDSIRLRKEHAFEGLMPNEHFRRKYISKFATDTSNYIFVLFENEMATDTMEVEWDSHKFNLKLVDEIK